MFRRLAANHIKNFTKFKLSTKRIQQHLSFSNDNTIYENIKKLYKKYHYKGKHFYRKNRIQFWTASLVGFVFLIFLEGQDYFRPEINYSQFLRMIENDELDQIIFYSKISKIMLIRKSQELYRVKIFSSEQVEEHIKKFKGKSPNLTITYREVIDVDKYWNYMKSGVYFYFLSKMIQLVYIIRSKKGNIDILGIGELTTSKAQKFIKGENVNIKFKDVAGISNVRREITEFVEFLKHPEKYHKMGAKIPKGALLYGPPGTGKTLLAKACAGEANVNFYYISGSQFLEMFVGIGASRVRNLFKQARENSPAIIFIDEIDAIGRKRSDKLSGSKESDSTLNQLLVEMDGFTSRENIVVFAATNRIDILDPALIRPGRLDRQIQVSLPDLKGREEIFMVHLKPIKLENEEEKNKIAKRMASLTPGFCGADIAQICNEAAINAVRKNQEFVNKFNFEIAIERIIGGIERKIGLQDEDEKTVAIHESGHGVVAWFLEGADPLLKLTIIPRSKGALGFAQYLPKENSLLQEFELRDKIVAILAGRIAEKVFFEEVTTGAYDDFQKAYNIAHAMVTKYGMSELGYLSLEEDQNGVRYYSEKTNQLIDEQCMKIIDEEEQRCLQIVNEHKNKIERMSKILLEKKTIEIDDIMSVLGPRPFVLSEGFREYIKGKANQ